MENAILGATISLAIGGLIGLEREWRHKEIGIRSFMLSSLFGYLCFFLGVPEYGLIAQATLVLLFLWKKETKGVTTEIAAFLAFLLGGMVASGLEHFAAPIAIIIASVLAFRDVLHKFSYSFTEQEILKALQFSIFSFVILPLLPNTAIDPFGLINPFRIWLMVVVVLGLSFLAYMTMKYMGPKGGMISTGILGGMASSTAVSFNMVELSKQKGLSSLAAGTAVLASSTMFLRLLFIIGLFDTTVLTRVAPGLLTAFVLGAAISLYLFRKKQNSKELGIKSPLGIFEAFKFATLFIVVTIIVKLGETYFGTAGVYAIAILGGLTDADPLVLSLLGAYTTGSLSIDIVSQAILLVAASNTVFKGIVCGSLGKYELKRLGAVSLFIIGALLFIW
ncbi:MAG: MgtC/SapB family protein [Candidatus Altiarchaeota archaeon]|nr:MgtC/SapB family protein [Candidatus Altiarchaeota archaeon]